jgi:hypothetical protein
MIDELKYELKLMNDKIESLKIGLQAEQVVNTALTVEVDRLKGAIRKHRDARGDDRCWIDDLELYRIIGDGDVDPSILALPSKCEFLESCSRFWSQRQHPDDQTIDPHPMTIAQLEAEIDRLKGVLTATRKGLGTAVVSDDRESWIREYNEVKMQRDSLLWMLYNRTSEVQILQDEMRSLSNKLTIEVDRGLK